MTTIIIFFAATEALLALACASWRAFKPPAQRRPMWAALLACHLLPGWWLSKITARYLLKLAMITAEHACERHEHAQAAAAFPPAGPRA